MPRLQARDGAWDAELYEVSVATKAAAPTAHEQFASLHTSTRERLSSLAHEWAAGEWSAPGFAEQMDEILLDAHTEAVVIGRTHAGDDSPREADDERFAAVVVEGEHEFLQAFRQELEAGRYDREDGTRDGEAVAARAMSYSARLTGTANETWSLTLPEETLIWWRTQEDQTVCPDCPELADASPWTPGSLVTVPGKNDTICLVACRCWLETEGGQRGFVTP